MKIKDLREDLPEKLDYSGDFKLTEISSKKDGKSNFSDISISKKNTDLRRVKYVKLVKSYNKSTDSLVRKNKKLSDIRLKKKNNILESIGFYKPRIKINKRPEVKNILLFLIIVLISFIGSTVLAKNLVENGYEKIIKTKSVGNIGELKLLVNNAKFDLISGKYLFKPASLIPNDSIDNANHVIDGGVNLIKFSDKLFSIFSSIEKYVNERGINNIYFTNLLQNNRSSFIELENLLKNSIQNYEKVENLGNDDINTIFQKNFVRLNDIYEKIKLINNNFELVLDILGKDQEKKYLILFQNNDEIRPTGGFAGSTGMLKIFDGKVKSFEQKDIYGYEWLINKVYKDKIKAPKGLDKITGTFGIRDANYYIHTDKSSEQISFFLDKIGIKIDGIIYINQELVRDFLEIDSGIDFKEYNEVITSENFSPIISSLVESKVSKEGTIGTPKKVLFDFQKVFFEKVKNNQNYSEYLKVILENIRSGDLFIYSFNQNENNFMKELGLTGYNDYYSSIDFAYPVFTSISGNKSDRYMKTSFEKEVNIGNNCKINTSFKIIRKHSFNKTEKEKLLNIFDKYNLENKDYQLQIQGNGDNYQYFRLVLPKNAQIEESEGQFIDDQYKDFKIVDIFIKTAVSETTTNTVNYSIENPDCREYDFNLFKQPGITEYNLKITKDKKENVYTGIDTDFYYNLK